MADALLYCFLVIRKMWSVDTGHVLGATDLFYKLKIGVHRLRSLTALCM